MQTSRGGDQEPLEHDEVSAPNSSGGGDPDIPDPIRAHFECWRGTTSLVEYVEREELHFNIIYGISRQGKSFMMREMMDFYLHQPNTLMILIKQTFEVEDYEIRQHAKAGRMLVMIYGDRAQRAIDTIIKEKERNIQAFYEGEEKVDPLRVVFFFDDIQGGFGGDTRLTYCINRALNELAKQGRHYNIVTYVGVQSYKSLHKDVRSQASLFLTMFPIDREYRRSIWEEFFHVGRFRDFEEISLPRYSVLGMIKADDRMIALRRD